MSRSVVRCCCIGDSIVRAAADEADLGGFLGQLIDWCEANIGPGIVQFIGGVPIKNHIGSQWSEGHGGQALIDFVRDLDNDWDQFNVDINQPMLGAGGLCTKLDFVLWCGGANDMNDGVPASFTYDLHLLFLNFLRAKLNEDSPLCQIIPMGGYLDFQTHSDTVDANNALMTQLYDAYDALHPTQRLLRGIDWRTALGAWDAATYADMVHPNAAGHTKIANTPGVGVIAVAGPILQAFAATNPPTMGRLETPLLNRIGNHMFGVAAFTPDANIKHRAYVAGVEVSSPSYAPIVTPNDTTFWGAASGGIKLNQLKVLWPQSGTGHNWGAIDEIRGEDAATGEARYRYTLALPVSISNGQRLVVNAGQLQLQFTGGMSDAWKNKALDQAFGGTNYTAETNMKFGYYAADPATGGAEITGSGYAKAVIPNSGSSWTAASGGVVVSAASVVLGPATAGNWTTAFFWALYDNAGTGRIFSAALPFPRTVINSQSETLLAGRIRPTLA